MPSTPTDARPPDGSTSKLKIDQKWNDRFVLLTRGFLTEFCLGLSRNAWMLYAAIGTFYNPVQKRAFPRLDMLEAICPLSRYSRSRALRELLTLGLVEVWGEKRGRRRRTFYRLPYVNEKRWHMAHPQQATGDELQDLIAKNQLPADLEWARRAFRKSRHAVCGAGVGYPQQYT